MGSEPVPLESLASENPAFLEMEVQPTPQVLPQSLCFLLRVAPRAACMSGHLFDLTYGTLAGLCGVSTSDRWLCK